jgi:hypothetical protein
MDIGGYLLGVNQQGREFDHSAPPSTEVKNECSYTFALLFIPSWH